MSVDATAELHFVHLGVPSPYPGEPDGHFSGRVTANGDASAGVMTLQLGAADVGETLLRINRLVLHNSSAVVVTVVVTGTQVSLVGPSELYRDTPFEVGSKSLSLAAPGLGAREVRPSDYPEGLWFWTRKGSTDVLRYTGDNTNSTVVSMAIFGWYWRMTRLRMHARRDWRIPSGDRPKSLR